MNVINISTAKDLRRTDNAQQYIFCKTAPKSRLLKFPPPVAKPTDELFVVRTIPIGLISRGACANAAHVVRKPIRKIIARTTVTFEKAPGYPLSYYVDTLSCGHEITTYAFEADKKSRGCEACLEALAVPLPERKTA